MKRTRSNNGTPALPAVPNGGHESGLSEADRKKQEAADRIAAMKARVAAAAQGQKPAAPPGKDVESAKREAAERIAAIKARLGGGAAKQGTPSPAGASPFSAPKPASPAPQSDAASRVQAQLAALKARAGQPRDPRTQPPPLPQRDEGNVRTRGGLGIGLHPALMGDLSAKPVARDHTGHGKQREGDARQAKTNPYISQDAAQEQKDDPTYDPGLQKQRDRKSRAIVFNQKGKFIAQAEALRAQERLERMKQEMQAEQRKQAIEEATERSYLVPEPPAIEWWDEGLVTGGGYGDLDAPNALNFEAITEYVQHPVLLEPPQEKNQPAPKAMYLTKKEQAKLRRQRRMEDHKEEQAKIRLGLVPPPPPKVKKSNLMRVLGQEAVKDPTAVEARVNRDIAQRAADHEVANESRKLSKEQRHEKLAQQQEGDLAKGVRVCVFRVENLSYGKHRYQIDVNAKQNSLTGITILNPTMNLVIVEGGAHSIKFYRKLMLNRIKWDENAAPVSASGNNREAEQEWMQKDWLQSLDERGMVKDLSFNRCTLVWEGEEKDRAFKKWTSRVCETDGEAKDTLGRNKMENMWTLAKSMQLD